MERKYILKGGFSLVFDRGVDFLGFESFFFLKGMVVVQDNEMVVYA